MYIFVIYIDFAIDWCITCITFPGINYHSGLYSAFAKALISKNSEYDYLNSDLFKFLDNFDHFINDRDNNEDEDNIEFVVFNIRSTILALSSISHPISLHTVLCF